MISWYILTPFSRKLRNRAAPHPDWMQERLELMRYLYIPMLEDLDPRPSGVIMAVAESTPSSILSELDRLGIILATDTGSHSSTYDPYIKAPIGERIITTRLDSDDRLAPYAGAIIQEWARQAPNGRMFNFARGYQVDQRTGKVFDIYTPHWAFQSCVHDNPTGANIFTKGNHSNLYDTGLVDLEVSRYGFARLAHGAQVSGLTSHRYNREEVFQPEPWGRLWEQMMSDRKDSDEDIPDRLDGEVEDQGGAEPDTEEDS